MSASAPSAPVRPRRALPYLLLILFAASLYLFYPRALRSLDDWAAPGQLWPGLEQAQVVDNTLIYLAQGHGENAGVTLEKITLPGMDRQKPVPLAVPATAGRVRYYAVHNGFLLVYPDAILYAPLDGSAPKRIEGLPAGEVTELTTDGAVAAWQMQPADGAASTVPTLCWVRVGEGRAATVPGAHMAGGLRSALVVDDGKIYWKERVPAAKSLLVATRELPTGAGGNGVGPRVVEADTGPQIGATIGGRRIPMAAPMARPRPAARPAATGGSPAATGAAPQGAAPGQQGGPARRRARPEGAAGSPATGGPAGTAPGNPGGPAGTAPGNPGGPAGTPPGNSGASAGPGGGPLPGSGGDVPRGFLRDQTCAIMVFDPKSGAVTLAREGREREMLSPYPVWVRRKDMMELIQSATGRVLCRWPQKVCTPVEESLPGREGNRYFFSGFTNGDVEKRFLFTCAAGDSAPHPLGAIPGTAQIMTIGGGYAFWTGEYVNENWFDWSKKGLRAHQRQRLYAFRLPGGLR